MLISEVDVSDLKHAEEEAHFLALHDLLTGLKNRAFLQQEFRNILSGAQRRGDSVGLLFVDIDRFKDINDSLGHAIGDELLIEIARRLRASVREADIVARAAGDEFLVLFREVASREQLGEAATRIRDDLSRLVIVGSRELQVTASIGISVFPADGADTEALMKSADLALYQAKEAGRNCHIYFCPAMKERADTRLETETLLRRALEQDEFELFYQPGKFLGCSSAPASRRTFRCGRREIERTFSHSDFRFDRERNVYVCSADELLKTTGNVGADHMVR